MGTKSANIEGIDLYWGKKTNFHEKKEKIRYL